MCFSETTWEDLPNSHHTSSIPFDIVASSTFGVFISGEITIYDSININSSSGQVSVKYSQLPTDIKRSEIEPNSFYLFQNYPNPFNPTIKIKYTIASNVKSETANSLIASGVVKLVVYDVLGKEVETLVNKVQPAGSYEIVFSAKSGSAYGGNITSLSSGIYFYQLRIDDFVETKKMVLLR